MDDLLRLDGRIVVVSGAGGGGIGTTVTRLAAEAGGTVVAVSRSKENLDEHVAPLAQPLQLLVAELLEQEQRAQLIHAARQPVR